MYHEDSFMHRLSRSFSSPKHKSNHEWVLFGEALAQCPLPEEKDSMEFDRAAVCY